MTSALVSIEADAGQHIAAITLSDPATHNALSPELARALASAAQEVGVSPGVRCVVVRGEGGSFASGADLKRIQRQTPRENLEFNRELRAAMDAVASLPMPSVAAVAGYALGGGLELALACTFRIGAPTTKVGLPEVRLGILPGTGGIERLPRTIGRGAAARILLTGSTVGGDEALELGLLDELAPDGDVDAAAFALARRVAGNAPLAVRAVVALLKADQPPGPGAEPLIEQHLSSLLASRDVQRGMSAFAQRRPAEFEGR
jgi:enoyl-CoA hydratase/carnithine racemase